MTKLSRRPTALSWIACLASIGVLVSCTDNVSGVDVIVAEMPPSAVPYVPPKRTKSRIKFKTEAIRNPSAPKEPLEGEVFGPAFEDRSTRRHTHQVVFAQDGQTVFTVNSSKTHANVQEWRWPEGTLVSALKIPNEAGTEPDKGNSIVTVGLSDDARFVFAKHLYTAPLRLWRVNNGRFETEIGDPRYPVSKAAISAAGSLIYQTSMRRQSRLLNINTNKTIQFGKGFDGAGSYDTYVRALSGQFTKEGNLQILTKTVSAGALSPDGKTIAQGYLDNTVRLYSSDDGKELHQFSIGRIPNTIEFAPDGNSLAVGTRQKLGYKKNERGYFAYEYLANESLLIAFDLSTRSERYRVQSHMHTTDEFSFSPDSQLLVTAGAFDPYVRVWKYQTGEEIASFFSNYGGIQAIAVSPDEKKVAISDGDHPLRILDIASGHPDEYATHCSFTICNDQPVQGG